jgi:Uma2 family endonuclease
LTAEEYLALDRAAEFRSEYYDGQMYAMSGASYVHGIIVGNLARAVGNALMGRGCGVVPNDLRVRLSSRAYAYPDLVITCGPPRLEDDRKDILLNPTFLLEVLSHSTETYDRGLKFSYYQRLESLQEYVLVSQTEARIEIFRRQPEGKWLYSEVRGLDASCRFDSLVCSIPLSEIYYQVSFDPLP